jgi:hypothetical protein
MNSRRLTHTLLAIALLMLAPQRSVAQATGSISGLVRAADTLGPLGDVTVALYRLDACNQPTIVDSKISNASGEYAFSALANGVYRISFHPGSRQPRYRRQYFDDRDGAPGSDITISSGNQYANINASLKPGGVFTGVLVDDQTGAPIDNVTVIASLVVTQPNASGESVNARTDGSGAFSLTGLLPGTHVVSIPSASFGSTLTARPYLGGFWRNGVVLSQTQTVIASDGSQTLDIGRSRVQIGGQIRGQVFGEFGVGTNDAEISILGAATGELVATTRPGTSLTLGPGAYASPGLPDGDYIVRAGSLSAFAALPSQRIFAFEYHAPSGNAALRSAASRFAIRNGAVVSDVNFQLEPGVQIAGRVTDTATAAILQPVVEIYDADGYNAARAFYQYDANPASPGYFYVSEPLPPGSYTVRFVGASVSRACPDVPYADTWFDNAPDRASATALVIASTSLGRPINAVMVTASPTPRATATRPINGDATPTRSMITSTPASIRTFLPLARR